MVSYNYRLPNINAAMGCVHMEILLHKKYVDWVIKMRMSILSILKIIIGG